MSTLAKFTSADLECFPDDGKRYELIEGELHVSKQPSWDHQFTCSRLIQYLGTWNDQTHLGFVNIAPGLLFADDDDVAPDVVWISHEQLQTSLESDRKLHEAPELVIEVLSPGTLNERRDRQTKLKLYSRRGVHEYWIVDCQRHHVEIHRREEGALKLAGTFFPQDELKSPLLPGFSCTIENLFFELWRKKQPTKKER